MKLPVRVNGVNVKVGPTKPGTLGSWDERKGTITISPANKAAAANLVILIHESMHMAETRLIQDGQIKRRVPERFVAGASFCVAAMLIGVGATNLSRPALMQWWKRTIDNTNPPRNQRLGRRKKGRR